MDQFLWLFIRDRALFEKVFQPNLQGFAFIELGMYHFYIELILFFGQELFS